MKQEIKIVLGALFGDEGKGNTVLWLCRQAINDCKSVAVVRFSGGPQAAHRTVYKDTEHISSSYGSGVLANVPTFYINPQNTFIDPIAVMEERKVLGDKYGYPQLTFDPMETRWITPYDVIANKYNDKVLKDGSCGKGIYTTFKRYQTLKNHENPDILLAEARAFWYLEKDEYLERKFKQCYYQLLSRQEGKKLEDYDVLIYEGTQGLLLDMDSEFYPNVTPSKVGIQTLQHLENPEIYVCSRVYLTRHGNGYNPKKGVELNIEIEDKCNPYNEFQGNMKYGYFELDLLKKSLKQLEDYNYNIVLTHCDKIKDYVPYIHDNKFYMEPLCDFVEVLQQHTSGINVFGSFSDRSNLFIRLT